MPTYEYQCPTCDVVVEEFFTSFSKSEDPTNFVFCPIDDTRMVKIMTAPAAGIVTGTGNPCFGGSLRRKGV
ncbi:MAG TPA: hypothetical protein VK553_02550 [Candidatus Nitrosopolaris rasttigaisensis]|nr:hypothetical protein [Candidatus Nitrosopolaris rasttigaisensis]